MCYSAQIEAKMSRTEKIFGAKVSREAFANFQFLQGFERRAAPETIKTIFEFSRTPKASQFKSAWDAPDSRIYPGYFAPVIVHSCGRRIVPMRYSLQPATMPPALARKYSLFNARMDTIATKKTWKSLLGRNHAILPFLRFFEWVEDDDGKKHQISFTPKGHEIMWAPALYDSWTSPGGEITFSSFALITDDPPPEVAETGHDRCPVFLHQDMIDAWLQPQGLEVSEIMEILTKRQSTYFEHAEAA